jgi:hypothetical protein
MGTRIAVQRPWTRWARPERASAHPEDLWFHDSGLVEFIEAAVPHRQRRARGRRPRVVLGDHARRCTDWALAVEARSRALLSDRKAIERLHGEAIARLSGTRVRAELGRARLPFAEWPLRAPAPRRARLFITATDRRGAAGLNQAGLRRDR